MKNIIKKIKRESFEPLIWSMINYKRTKILRNSVLLISIRKSGTNYLRLLITNYIYNLDNYAQGKMHDIRKVTYNEMHNKIFPNNGGNVFNEKAVYKTLQLNKSNLFLKNYKDFIYDHAGRNDKLLKFIRPKKLILIYRNPFDQLISLYYYKYKNRVGKENAFSHPREIIDKILPVFINSYKWMKQVAMDDDKSRVIMVSYEQLVLEPYSTMINIIQFLNLPVYPELINLSIRFSSKAEVRKEEKKKGEAIHSPKEGLRDSFVRSGKVGQWKEYFSSEDFEIIVRKLDEKGINYKEFWLTDDF